MKEGIHPRYVECTVTCGCGNTFETWATTPDLHVEICSACHPFYTGKQKFVDTEGRVKKFENRHGWNKDAMDKLLAKNDKKEKRTPRREKVSVGVPKAKKRKPAADERTKKAKYATKEEKTGAAAAAAKTRAEESPKKPVSATSSEP